MSLYAQGLTLSLMAMLVTFASLGLFILIIVLLQRLFGEAEPAEEPSDRPAPSATSASPTVDRVEDARRAAAIAVAIALEDELPRSGELGAALTQGRGRWWSHKDAASSSPLPNQFNRRPS